MNAPATTLPAVNHFCFESNKVRTITDEYGDHWFVTSDVCSVLQITNVGNATKRIPDNHKGIRSMDTLGGRQKVSVIDEPGLYRLILRSDKPQAEPFMEWITSEVIPSIRKTGKYSVAQPPTTTAQPKPPTRKTELNPAEFRVLQYTDRKIVLVAMSEDGVPWFRASDIFAALGYVAPVASYFWIYKEGKYASIVTNGATGKIDHFLSPGNMKRIVMRSGKHEKFDFSRWVDSVALPELGQKWRMIDDTNHSLTVRQASTPTVAKKIDSNDQIFELLQNSRFIMHFDHNGQMQIRPIKDNEGVFSLQELAEHLAAPDARCLKVYDKDALLPLLQATYKLWNKEEEKRRIR